MSHANHSNGDNSTIQIVSFHFLKIKMKTSVVGWAIELLNLILIQIDFDLIEHFGRNQMAQCASQQVAKVSFICSDFFLSFFSSKTKCINWNSLEIKNNESGNSATSVEPTSKSLLYKQLNGKYKREQKMTSHIHFISLKFWYKFRISMPKLKIIKWKFVWNLYTLAARGEMKNASRTRIRIHV